MKESQDETGAGTEVKSARAPWRHPSFRIVPARDAEIGVDINVSDGAFTTS